MNSSATTDITVMTVREAIEDWYKLKIEEEKSSDLHGVSEKL